MGIKFAKDKLLTALKTAAAFAGKFVAEREGMPNEQMVLMRLMFNGVSLIVEATNLEMGIHMEIPAPGSSEVRSYQLPAKTLLDAVSASGAEIELVHEKAGLGVKTQTGKSTIKNVAGDLIPLIDCGAAATTTTHFTCAEMAKAINMVALAAAKEDEARPYLCGVRVMPEHDGSVTFVAADGVRMAVYTTRTTTPEAFATPFTLPIASVPAITNCLAIQHGNVALTVISNQAIFHWNWRDENENNFNGYVFALRQADNFPDWHALVPRTCKTKLTFDGALAAALKTARVIARESVELPKVTLKIIDLKAVVKSEVAEVGVTSTEVTPISVEGMNDVEVSFNINLVPIAQIGASGVVIGLNPLQQDSPGPIIWKLPGVEGWQYLLMPLRSF